MTRSMHELQALGFMQIEADQLYENLRDVSEARPKMAEMLGLMEQRREAYMTTGVLTEAIEKKTNELEMNIRNLQKVGGLVIDERMAGLSPRARGCSGREAVARRRMLRSKEDV